MIEKLVPLYFRESAPEYLDDGSCLLWFGRPIDYIGITRKGVDFIEIKTGKSDLTANERQLKDHIDNGRVRWRTVRVK